jgi:WD40 repeat protein
MGDKIMSLAAAPQGSLVALALESGALKVLDLETGEEVFSQQFQGGVAALSWSFDGRYLAAGTDQLIQIWDMEQRELVQSIKAANDILAPGWGSKGHLLASGSYRGILDLWSAESGEHVWVRGDLRERYPVLSQEST